MQQPSNSPKSSKEEPAQAIAEWRQGDFALGVGEFFLHTVPSTVEGELFESAVDESIAGLVVISQTCDIVNDGLEGFVTVCPLVEINAEQVANVGSGRTPIYAAIEGVSNNALVADLTRMATVSKALLVQWPRSIGFQTADYARQFAHALERKHGRFAYPDDFVRALDKLRNRIFQKHGKPESDVGKIYRSILEIRVRAAPSWDAADAEIGFIFILNDKDKREASHDDIAKEIAEQMAKINLPKPFRSAAPPYLLVTLDDLKGRDIIESIALDYHSLTISGR